MFNFLKKNGPENSQEPSAEKPKRWLSRLNNGLKRTRSQLGGQLTTLFLGRKQIDDALFEELEEILLMADVGIDASKRILDNLANQVSRKELNDPNALFVSLQQQLNDALQPYAKPIDINKAPFVILMVGINGAGKTTSIAKIAHHYKALGKKVMLAAGDTFRAAAIEQLQVWGQRNDVTVIAQHNGADSASVIFDSMQAAQARGIDILIADTAGRLHTQSHLMEELKKIRRVIQKQNPEAPHETILVIDASQGQNALNQAEQFHEAIQLSGLVVTKLDGTAKGGMVFAITDKMKLPIRFIGVGEQIDDLKPFVAEEFVTAILGE